MSTYYRKKFWQDKKAETVAQPVASAPAPKTAKKTAKPKAEKKTAKQGVGQKSEAEQFAEAKKEWMKGGDAALAPPTPEEMEAWKSGDPTGGKKSTAKVRKNGKADNRTDSGTV